MRLNAALISVEGGRAAAIEGFEVIIKTENGEGRPEAALPSTAAAAPGVDVRD